MQPSLPWPDSHGLARGSTSKQTAKENGILFHSVHIDSREKAQNAPTPVTNYALFYDGRYITNEQMNDKRFLKLVKANSDRTP